MDHQLSTSPNTTIPWEAYIRAYQEVKSKVVDTEEEAVNNRNFKRDKLDDEELFEAITSSNPSGFHIEYEIRDIPGKGRGIFTTQDIPKGTKICDDRCGRFLTEEQYREFLGSLSSDLAHECVDWAGVDDYHHQEVVFLGFSDSNLLNHGASLPPPFLKRLYRLVLRRTKPLANIVECDWCVVAKRDIQAGEELLIDYDEICNYNHKLDWFTKIYDEHYPETPHATEIKRWS